MLSKLTTSAVTWTWKIWPYSKEFGFSASGTIDTITNNTSATIYVSATVPYHISAQTGSTGSAIQPVYNAGGGNVNIWSVISGNKYNVEVDGSATISTVSLNPWVTLRIWYTTPSGYATPNNTKINSFYISFSATLTNDKQAYYWKPIGVSNIWELEFINIFWVTDSWIFNAWKEVTTVTTWNITPGNFVGYIQLGKYKIPYYK